MARPPSACELSQAHALGLVEQHLSEPFLMREAWNAPDVEQVIEDHSGFFAAIAAATDRVTSAVLAKALHHAFEAFSPKAKLCLC